MGECVSGMLGMIDMWHLTYSCRQPFKRAVHFVIVKGFACFKKMKYDAIFLVFFQIFGFLICMGIILAIGNTIWEQKVGSNFWEYLQWKELTINAVFSGFLTFWSYIIILNTVVPISLYVR